MKATREESKAKSEEAAGTRGAAGRGTASIRTFRQGGLSFLKQYFEWLAREDHRLSNPAFELELPKVEKSLPKHVLTATEAEAILTQPDIRKPGA